MRLIMKFLGILCLVICTGFCFAGAKNSQVHPGIYVDEPPLPEGSDQTYNPYSDSTGEKTVSPDIATKVNISSANRYVVWREIMIVDPCDTNFSCHSLALETLSKFDSSAESAKQLCEYHPYHDEKATCAFDWTVKYGPKNITIPAKTALTMIRKMCALLDYNLDRAVCIFITQEQIRDLHPLLNMTFSVCGYNGDCLDEGLRKVIADL
jgi:hypothetical protein